MKVLKNFYVLIASMCLILVGGCGRGKQAARPPTPVVSAKVTVADLPLYIEAIGSCVASESVAIVPQVSGQIVAVNFKQGQKVEVGDPLYAIDSRVYEENLKKAESQLMAAKAKWKVDIAQLERSKALVPQNYIAQQQYEAYETQVEQDIASVDVANAQVAQAKIDVERCNIVSPIDGIAGAYLVDVGNVVGAMSINKPLVTVENVDQLYVEFSISENDFYDLQKFFNLEEGSLKMEVSPISNDGVKGEAYVDFINNSIDRRTGSIKLRASMENPEHRFWPGQSVRTKLLLTVAKDSVLVPAEAVKLGQQGRYVFVIKEDKSVEFRPVEIGQIHGDMLVIKNGVSEGETIVMRGQLMLAPGMKVMEMPDTQPNSFGENLEKNRKIAEKNPTTK
ncbi:MAG: efflux RND transporter periplasmic adaptor subunit [Puniceicoccales bacterium]|jgi:multidrug efflux system membrane fusion protein|nr:efflux RND transporter periplasmic adaptor subunit [Puniceicoccales bacterium]